MAELATIARPYAEALFQSAKPAELASFMEQLGELAQLAVLPEIASLSNNPKAVSYTHLTLPTILRV